MKEREMRETRENETKKERETDRQRERQTDRHRHRGKIVDKAGKIQSNRFLF